MKNILKVENPVYNTKQDIRKLYKGYHVYITNIKRTPPGVPDTWLGGIVRFYSNDLTELNKFYMEHDIEEYGDSMLIYTGDTAPDSFSLRGLVWN
jgi:hypothetical protein